MVSGGAPAAELLWPYGRLEGWRGAAPDPRVGRGGRRLLRALPAGARTMPGDPGGGGSSGHRRLRVPHLPVRGHGALGGAPRVSRAPASERAQRPKLHYWSLERGAPNARQRRGRAGWRVERTVALARAPLGLLEKCRAARAAGSI